MLNFSGERIVPEADNCEPLFAMKMYQEHIARYLFASQVAQGKTVLDVGCGVGYGSQLLARKGASKVTAFDISEAAIAHAAEFYPHPNVRHLVASAEDFSFQNKFDLITCFELIEHLPRQHEAAKKIAAALSDEGVLVISTPRPTGEQQRSAFHVRELSFLEFANLLDCYFPHVEWFFENNHFASVVAGSAPEEIGAIQNLQQQFSLGQADYFVAVASHSPINRQLFQNQLVLNNDAYVKNLERDIEILRRAEHDFKDQVKALGSEVASLHSTCELSDRKCELSERENNSLRSEVQRLGSQADSAKEALRASNTELEKSREDLEKSREDLEKSHEDLIQLRGNCASLELESAQWRESAFSAQAAIQALEQQVNSICASRSWKVTEPLRRLAFRARRHSGSLTAPSSESAIPVSVGLDAPKPLLNVSRRQCDVVYVIGCHEGESKRYRVHNLVQALTKLGFVAEAIADNEVGQIIEQRYTCRVVVLFRCAYSNSVRELLLHCRDNGIATIFDIDDLVFEPESIGYVHVVNTFNANDRAAYLHDVGRYRQTLLECNRATCTTSYLAQRISALGKPVDVIPNFINDSQVALSRALEHKPELQTQELRIGYFSGSNTHQVDFAACEPALLDIVRRYPQVRFVLMGILDLGPAWDSLKDRVERHPMAPYDKMLRILASVHVNLAPLEVGNPYCEGKSQLKIFEAGLVSVPTIASLTQSYREAIDDGVDGLLASTTEEWAEALEKLIASDTLRRTMGAQAKKRALKQFGPEPVARQAAQVYGLSLRASTLRDGEPERLKITWIVPGILIGGGGHRNILRAAYYLEQFGHDLELYFTSTEMDSYELKETVRTHFYPLQCPMHRYTGNINPTDVLLATHWSTVDAAVRARDSVRELMYFVQDFEPLFAPMGTEYILAENTYRLGLYHITSGPWCQAVLRKEYGCEADYFQFPIDRSIYHTRARSKRRANILFFAKPEMPRRCFDLGVMALGHFHRLRPDVEIVLFGSRQIEKITLPFPVTKRSLLPTIEDLAQLYADADLGLVFSTTNPSLVPYEMMACGLPVVDLGRPGNEVNYGGRTDIALLADPAPEIMAQQMSDLLDNREDLLKRSRNGLEFVSTFPSEIEMARRVEELILGRMKKNELSVQ